MMPPAARILIVDDEPQIMRFLTHALQASGYQVSAAATGADALAAFASHGIDLVVLDLRLPDMDGKEVIEALRKTSTVPIIVLSAHDQEMERILALDLGADDFVPKPFGIGELLARARACLRKSAASDPQLQWPGLRLNLETRQVFRHDQEVRLTRKEFDLMVLLARNEGRVMRHKSLLEAIWGPAHKEDVPYLRVFIGQIRRKLSSDLDGRSYLQTAAGVGYRWAVEEA